MSSSPHEASNNEATRVSNSPHDEAINETVQPGPFPILRQSTVAKLPGFASLPVGLRLFPIVFFCTFLDLIQMEIYTLYGRFFEDTVCIPWSVHRNTEICTRAGFIFFVVSAIQLGGPITGKFLPSSLDMRLIDIFPLGLIAAILIPRLSMPNSRVQLLRSLIRIKLLTTLCFVMIFYLHFWPMQDILCLALVITSLFTTLNIILVCKMMVVEAKGDNKSWFV
jgi:hypothetical protein